MEKNEWRGHNPTEKEQAHIDELMVDAYEALAQPARTNHYLSLEEREHFHTVADKRDDSFLFYELLWKEMPELGVSLDDESVDGLPLDKIESAAVKIVPGVTDEKQIDRMLGSDMIAFLTAPSLSEKISMAKDLEGKGLLSRSDANRVLLRAYMKEREKYPNNYEDEINDLQGVIPMSDEEVKELMRGAVIEAQRENMLKE